LSLLIAGTVTLDTIEVGEHHWEDLPGGSALYAAAAATRLASCRILGVAGDDFPRACLERFVQQGADVAGVALRPGSTFRWHARYASDLASRQTLYRDLGVAGELPRVPPAWAHDPGCVLLGSMDPAIQRAVLATLESPGFVGLDTMDHWIRAHRNDLLDVLAQADVVFVNEGEVRLLGQSHALGAAARHVLDCGPSVVVVTRGARGAWMLQRGEDPRLQPAAEGSAVVDPTGAGDAFAGAFMAVVQGEQSLDQSVLERALSAGAAAASVAIEGTSFDRLLDFPPERLDDRR